MPLSTALSIRSFGRRSVHSSDAGGLLLDSEPGSKSISVPNKHGILMSIELDHSPVLFAYPKTGCKLTGRVGITSTKKSKVRSLAIAFLEHEYFEFGVPRENKIPFVLWQKDLEAELLPGVTHYTSFRFQLPDNLHTTVFTKFNCSRYELVATAKTKGASGSSVCAKDLALYSISLLLSNPLVAKAPFAIDHEWTQGQIRVTFPSPFAYANSIIEVGITFIPRTPYYYLARVSGQFVEIIEYTRSDGSVLATAMEIDGKRVISEVYDVQPSWYDPVPLTNNMRVTFKVALPKMITTPRRENWATATRPATMPDPSAAPFVLYDVENTHLRIRHGLSYKIELLDIRGIPLYITSTVLIGVIPPLPETDVDLLNA